MTDFALKSAIFRPLTPQDRPAVSRIPTLNGDKMAELLMNSAFLSERSMRAGWSVLCNGRCATGVGHQDDCDGEAKTAHFAWSARPMSAPNGESVVQGQHRGRVQKRIVEELGCDQSGFYRLANVSPNLAAAQLECAFLIHHPAERARTGSLCPAPPQMHDPLGGRHLESAPRRKILMSGDR